MCDTYHCDYVSHTTFHFYLIDFQSNTDFPSKFKGFFFFFFFVKSLSITQRSVSPEKKQVFALLGQKKKGEKSLFPHAKLEAQIVLCHILSHLHSTQCGL